MAPVSGPHSCLKMVPLLMGRLWYLVENAASMLQIHLDACCKLLGLPIDLHGRYIWDPWDFKSLGSAISFGTLMMSRKLNYLH